jgi:hypothetical protein
LFSGIIHQQQDGDDIQEKQKVMLLLQIALTLLFITQILASKRQSRAERFRATACPDFDRDFIKCKALTKKKW